MYTGAFAWAVWTGPDIVDTVDLIDKIKLNYVRYLNVYSILDGCTIIFWLPMVIYLCLS